MRPGPPESGCFPLPLRPTIDDALSKGDLPMPIRSEFRAALIGVSLLAAACENPSTTGPDSKTPVDSLDAQAGNDKRNKYDFLQGKLMATGQVTDLGIEGGGLFILANGTDKTYFRRPACFTPDADGYLTLGNAKFRLQGIPLSDAQDPYATGPADSAFATGVPLTALADIRWPFNDIAPPRATTRLRLARNLDSDSYGKGSILYTQKFLHHAQNIDQVIGLAGNTGDPLDMQPGDILTFSASADGSTITATFPIGDAATLANLTTALTAFLRSASVGAGLGTTAEMVDAPDAGRGAITVYGNTGPIRNLHVTSDRPVSGPKVTKAFALPDSIPAGTTRLKSVTEALRAPARAEDPLYELYDATGNPLGLEAGDVITFSGSIGGNPAANALPIVYADGPGGTRLAAILAKLQENFKLPDVDGSIGNYRSVTIDPAGSDNNIPDGSIVIRGQPGLKSAIRDVVMRATDQSNAKPSPNFFNTNADATTLRDAIDTQTPEAFLGVFDASGKEHTLTIRFTPTNTHGTWVWEAMLGGDGLIRKGARGKLRFGEDYSVEAFATDAGDTRLEFDPMNGSANVTLDIEAGGPGDFAGLTEFRTPSTAAIVSRNGFPAGKLLKASIGEDGVISATYANGQMRFLYRIPLADFPNRKGLEQAGVNTFVETAASGKPVVSVVASNATGGIKPEALEWLTEEDFKQVCAAFPDCATAK